MRLKTLVFILASLSLILGSGFFTLKFFLPPIYKAKIKELVFFPYTIKKQKKIIVTKLNQIS